ncbi:hypothetical protein JCM8115_005473 [Rhodotorula mucilaginosa]|uniref:rRNA-processing protein EFG1 n=1 Tax=Rhodotorula mucilaginosa TaxID=5537 RepID=A0A9P6W486_RHOMI|nr:18S rRNA maturation protein [Rhodotorula mucilaginosa]TKA51514.1 hypothetical protein B0A53_05569 [Rhodotorula sp. CCFEE 5036]
MAEGYASNPTRGGRGRGGGGRGGRGSSSSSSRGRNGQSQQQEQGAIPAGSVSKLKAQIRQTKRLLAREDLTPDVRTTTERRMVALESELEKTSQSKVEKKMVQRYRGVKFFERQKLLRKIKQAKKQLAEVPESADAQRALLEARIDLYYVLRYPKSEKYIALFPDGTYVPPLASLSELASDATPSERKRQTLRLSLRDQVKRGELPAEAELGELGIEGEEDVGSGPATIEKKRERPDETEKEEGEGEEREQAAQQEEEQGGSDERPTKRIRSAEKEEQEETAADASTGGKKEKENRKQRKERKRAEAGAAQATSPAAAAAAAKGASGKKKGSVGGGKKAASVGKEDLAAEDDFFA